MLKRSSFVVLAALVLTACGSGGGGGTIPAAPTAPPGPTSSPTSVPSASPTASPTTAPSPTAMPLPYLNGQATISRYMGTVDTTVTNKEGCDMAQGVSDQAKSGIVVLDFGEPFLKGADQGTSMFGSGNPFVSTAQITTAVEGYLDGYALCNQPATNSLILAVGTSNYGGNVTAAHAAAWVAMLQTLTSYITTKGYANEKIAAADDMETGWGGATTTRTWLDAYVAAAGSIPIYDYGDAGGCPEGSYSAGATCTANADGIWSQSDVAYMAGGAGPHVLALPEIYNTSGASAKQWGWIGSGAVDASKPLTYAAVMTQVGSCGTSCSGLDNTPADALSLLNAQLASHTQTASDVILLSTDMSSAN